MFSGTSGTQYCICRTETVLDAEGMNRILSEMAGDVFIGSCVSLWKKVRGKRSRSNHQGEAAGKKSEFLWQARFTEVAFTQQSLKFHLTSVLGLCVSSGYSWGEN